MERRVSHTLKEFGLTDDQILNIAIEDRLMDAIALLRDYLYDKWDMDKITAFGVVKKLKQEFE